MKQHRITITVSKTIYDNLKALKQDRDAKTWGKLISLLLMHYRAFNADSDASPTEPLISENMTCKMPVGNLLEENGIESLLLEVS